MEVVKIWDFGVKDEDAREMLDSRYSCKKRVVCKHSSEVIHLVGKHLH